MKRVLFVCVHNSARSQMAEAFLNELSDGKFYAESAGLEPGKLNPLVVKVMDEIGIDISKKNTNSVFEYLKEGRTYSIVVKVCDQINGQRCPIFPSAGISLNWNIADPSVFTGTDEEKLDQIRAIRDEIKSKVEALITVYG